jgi:hypothetical protein
MKICFYNHWHNGDVFAGKGWMQEMQRQLPEFEFTHAQKNSVKTMQDLRGNHVLVSDIPREVGDRIRYIHLDDTLYINTWIGAYGNAVIPDGEHHANWTSLHTMWMHIYDMVEHAIDKKLARTADMETYMARTDWTKYEIGFANQFLGQRDRIVLICNGVVQSTQSELRTMEDILSQMSHDYPDIAFVCTSKFEDTNWPMKDNVFFTDDIFASATGGDINEIAYLSTHAEVIVGKNSGPFMFTHVWDNIMNPNKAFVSLSHRPSDSYPYNVVGIACRYYHHSSDVASNVNGVIRQAINEKGQAGTGQMKIIDY